MSPPTSVLSTQTLRNDLVLLNQTNVNTDLSESDGKPVFALLVAGVGGHISTPVSGHDHGNLHATEEENDADTNRS